MGILNKSKVYLAGPIEAETREGSVAWRQEFKEKVSDMGIICLSPLDKVFINFETEGADFAIKMRQNIKQGQLIEAHLAAQAIRRRDLAMLDHSEFVVVYLNTNVKTYGTIEEMSFAARANKPVYIIVKPDVGHIPIWVLGMFAPKRFFNTVDEVVDNLKDINSGKIELGQESWRIFEPEYLT